tara:strand:+ start:2395 stop:2724 length:330 start_codon:yes stop_codon:yes gene_type:complete
MKLDHDAIFKAYPTIVSYDDSYGLYGIDANGNKVTIEESKVSEAKTILDTEAAAVKYKTDRTTNGSTTYDTIGNQLGMLYDDIIAGKLDATGSFAIHNKAVKDANPKPN